MNPAGQHEPVQQMASSRNGPLCHGFLIICISQAAPEPAAEANCTQATSCKDFRSPSSTTIIWPCSRYGHTDVIFGHVARIWSPAPGLFLFDRIDTRRHQHPSHNTRYEDQDRLTLWLEKPSRRSVGKGLPPAPAIQECRIS
jgi:hypothetical protein